MDTSKYPVVYFKDMFYTKYRPQKFSDVLRPNEAADALSKQVKNKKTVHAYLFVGPRGIGKTTLARLLAKALNCEKLDEKTGDPCDKCSNCKAIKTGAYADLIEIDAASNRGIDDIRDLKNKIKLAPVKGQHKVYIIDEVHMLTTEAFNALLKTLEEPPKNVTFILCTTEMHKVPDTIKSRCQVFKLKRATIAQITQKLEKIAKTEKIKISKEDLEKIAKASLGGYRDAETLLQQIAEGDISVEALLGPSSQKEIIDFVENLMKADAKNALKIIDSVYSDGIDLYVWVGEVIKYLRDLLFVTTGLTDEIADLTEDLIENIKSQAREVSSAWLVNALEILTEAHVAVKTSFITQLPIELAVVKICTSPDSVQESPPASPVSPQAKNPEKLSKRPQVSKPSAPVVETTEETEGGTPVIDLSEIQDKWQEVVKKSKDLNHSLTALLKSGKPVDIKGKVLVLDVFYAFHKDRLEAPKNRKLVEGLLEEVLGKVLTIKCNVCDEKPKKLKKGESGVLTDKNVFVPAPSDAGSLLEAFDGNLPAIG